MDKKDIYEHLADIYLDASSKRKKKAKVPAKFKNLFYISVAIIFVLTFFIFFTSAINNKPQFASLNGYKPAGSLIKLVLNPDIVKINFNFDSAKEEAYYVDLNNLDLAHFKVLGFLVRKAHYEDNIILKVEFTNAYTEKSEIQFYDIPSYRWQEYKINFSDFKNISDWSKMSSLSFIIEERNVTEKKGIVYIDNVRFLR